MKTRSVFATILVIVALLALTMPVAADRNEPVGEQIRVRDTTIEFPAGTAFNIRHGWLQPSTDEAIGVFDFKLDLDGFPQPESYMGFSASSGDPDMLTRLWVYNFPAGMEGTHTFTGHWFAPCQYAVDQLGYTGQCDTPNAKVENATRELTIIFVP